MQSVIKVLTSSQWDALRRAGTFAGSPDDVRDGFIHLSTPGQVGETIRRHFAGEDLLVLLTFDAESLGEDVRWEPSRGGEDFPHLYGPLRLDDVVEVRRLTREHPGRTEVNERYRVLDPVPRDADERTMLEPLLDWYRDGVLAKVAGLSDDRAAQLHLRSETTIVGLVNHLALVEESWFVQRFAGEPRPQWWADVDWEAEPDWEFTSAREGTLDEALDRYRRAIARSREIQSGAQLDDLAADPGPRGPFNLRWLLLHMLEEIARHLGHLDVLRELTDGATGE